MKKLFMPHLIVFIFYKRETEKYSGHTKLNLGALLQVHKTK